MKITFSGALALLLFSSVIFAGYSYLEGRNLEAQAVCNGCPDYRWQYVAGNHAYYIKACKDGSSSAYVLFANRTSSGIWATGNGIKIKYVYANGTASGRFYSGTYTKIGTVGYTVNPSALGYC